MPAIRSSVGGLFIIQHLGYGPAGPMLNLGGTHFNAGNAGHLRYNHGPEILQSWRARRLLQPGFYGGFQHGPQEIAEEGTPEKFLDSTVPLPFSASGEIAVAGKVDSTVALPFASSGTLVAPIAVNSVVPLPFGVNGTIAVISEQIESTVALPFNKDQSELATEELAGDALLTEASDTIISEQPLPTHGEFAVLVQVGSVVPLPFSSSGLIGFPDVLSVVRLPFFTVSAIVVAIKAESIVALPFNRGIDELATEAADSLTTEASDPLLSEQSVPLSSATFAAGVQVESTVALPFNRGLSTLATELFDELLTEASDTILTDHNQSLSNATITTARLRIPWHLLIKAAA